MNTLIYEFAGMSLMPEKNNLISSNTVIAGAHRDDDKGSDAGAVYIFEPEPPTHL